MKRLIVAGLLALLLIGAVGGAIMAAGEQSTAPAPAPVAKARPQPTEKQKAELTDLHNQMLALREKMIDKYLEYGWITKEQANYMKDQIALQKKYAGQLGAFRGPGAQGGRRGHRGGMMAPGAGMGFGAGMMGPGAGMMGW